MKRMTNRDRGFYTTLGPFLSRRAIVKEVGGPIWDEDDKHWWVALQGRTVLGFAAARETDDHVRFMSAYVLPEHRRQGIYRTLFQARMQAYAGRSIGAVCTDASLPLMRANGFTVVRQRGSFTDVAHGH